MEGEWGEPVYSESVNLGDCCGVYVTKAMNQALTSFGGDKLLPSDNLGTGIPAYLAKNYGVPLLNRNDITLESISQPGTVIAMTRQPGDKNYKYGRTHAEVTATNPATGELMIASKSSGKNVYWKKLNQNYIDSLPAATTAANPFSSLARKANAIAASAQPQGEWGEAVQGEWGEPVQDQQESSISEQVPQEQMSAAGAWLKENSPAVYDYLQKTQNFFEDPNLAMNVVRPTLEMGGLVGGGLLGSAAGPAGSVAGGGLGYAAGKTAADWFEGKSPTTAIDAIQTLGTDVATGAAMEMGGQAMGVVLPKAVGAIGKTGRPILGRMSGTGTGAVEEALKGSDDFVKALRGKITSDEVVENAQTALQRIRNIRSDEYTTKLQQISNINQNLDTRAISQKLSDLFQRFNVKVDPVTGEVDYSRIAMGTKGRKDIEKIVETVSQWGTKPGDNTPVGLDILKRQLDDFYSDSSQARAFVTSIRNAVKDTIVKNVPEYAEMTKGYSEMTKLIKDIETGLMMRKHGMSGRIVADQTLRRLVSAMRDNFELRRDLVNILSKEGGQDVAGQVAGHAMSAVLPRGIMGPATIIEGGLALSRWINPKIWPFLVASSPRLQGEFLQLYGKGLKELSGATLPVAKITAYLALMQKEAKKQNNSDRQ